MEFGDMPLGTIMRTVFLINLQGFERIQYCTGQWTVRRCGDVENCKSHIPPILSRVGPAYMRCSCTIEAEVITQCGSSGESLEFPMSYKHSHRRPQPAIHRSHVQCQSVNFGSLERKRMPCVAASGCSATTLAAGLDENGRTKEKPRGLGPKPSAERCVLHSRLVPDGNQGDSVDWRCTRSLKSQETFPSVAPRRKSTSPFRVDRHSPSPMVPASMASTGNGRIGRAHTSVEHLPFLARLLAPPR